MTIVSKDETQVYCGGNSPDLETSGDLLVYFYTNRRRSASGAQCTIQCSEEVQEEGKQNICKV